MMKPMIRTRGRMIGGTGGLTRRRGDPVSSMIIDDFLEESGNDDCLRFAGVRRVVFEAFEPIWGVGRGRGG